MTPKERYLELTSRNGPRSGRVEKRSKRQHRPWEDLGLRKQEEVVSAFSVFRAGLFQSHHVCRSGWFSCGTSSPRVLRQNLRFSYRKVEIAWSVAY